MAKLLQVARRTAARTAPTGRPRQGGREGQMEGHSQSHAEPSQVSTVTIVPVTLKMPSPTATLERRVDAPNAPRSVRVVGGSVKNATGPLGGDLAVQQCKLPVHKHIAEPLRI